MRSARAVARRAVLISRKSAPRDIAAERFVLDASVAIDWFLPGSGSRSRYAEGILERIGLEVASSSPEELAARINLEITKWGKVIKDVGIKAD